LGNDVTKSTVTLPNGPIKCNNGDFSRLFFQCKQTLRGKLILKVFFSLELNKLVDFENENDQAD
jgi:hypothetical protein